MVQRPPCSTPTVTLLPSTTLFLSSDCTAWVPCGLAAPPLSSLDFMRGSTSLLCFPFADVRSMRVIASFRPQEMKIYPVSPIQRYCLLVTGRKNYGAEMNVGACLYQMGIASWWERVGKTGELPVADQ